MSALGHPHESTQVALPPIACAGQSTSLSISAGGPSARLTEQAAHLRCRVRGAEPVRGVNSSAPSFVATKGSSAKLAPNRRSVAAVTRVAPRRNASIRNEAAQIATPQHSTETACGKV